MKIKHLNNSSIRILLLITIVFHLIVGITIDANAYGPRQISLENDPPLVIEPDDPQAGEQFGSSVSISGDTIAISAPKFKNENGDEIGAIYIFERDAGGPDQWEQVKRITLETAENLGTKVVIDGDVLVAKQGSIGDISIFYRDEDGSDNWGRVKIITNNTGFTLDFDLSGDMLAIGQTQSSGNGYVSIHYRNKEGEDMWGEVKKISLTPSVFDDGFGEAVAFQDDFLAVGAPKRDIDEIASGAVYLFEKDEGGTDNWGQTKRFTPSDGEKDDLFGAILDFSGDTLAVAVKDKANYDFSGAGAIYIYEKDEGGEGQWGQTNRLTAPVLHTDDKFGRSISLNGDVLFSSAKIFNPDQYSIFNKNRGGTNNWGIANETLKSPSSAEVAFGGSGIDAANNLIVVGDKKDSTSGEDAGRAFIWMQPMSDLTIIKTVSTEIITPNKPMTYTITVTNNGENQVQNLEIIDYLPAGITNIQPSGTDWDCSLDNNELICTLPNLDAGASAPDITIDANSPEKTGWFYNQVSVTSDNFDLNLDDNQYLIDTECAYDGPLAVTDLQITKTASDDVVFPGTTFTYTLSVVNNGDNEAVNVEVVDYLPCEVTQIFDEGTSWTCDLTDKKLTCTLPSLPSLETAEDIIIEVKAPSETGWIYNQASVTSDNNESNPDDNQSGITTLSSTGKGVTYYIPLIIH